MEKLGFAKGTRDSILHLKQNENGLLIIEIFRGNDEASDNFFEEMKNEFEMSMIGEMKFFLGLKIMQNTDGMFISQDK